MPATATDRLNGVTTSVAVKPPCRVATTANITLSGLQTIDGVTVVADDRVLVKNQTDTTKNGIYEANTSAWTRAPDFDGALDAVNGSLVIVRDGSTNNQTIWRLTTANPVQIGTSAITFEKALLQDLGSVVFTQAGAGAVQRPAQDKMRDIVNVKDFKNSSGVQVAWDGATDDTTGLAAARDAVKLLGGGIVFLPQGTGRLTEYVHKTTVSLKGAGSDQTILKPLASAGASFIYLPTAPVINSNIEGLTIDGGSLGLPINTSQWAMNMIALTDGTQGGWWYSHVRDVVVKNFNFCIQLKGGTTLAQALPNQFLLFERVMVFRSSHNAASGRCLKLSGQVDQVQFLSCQFDGETFGTGTNVEAETPTAASGSAPSNITFTQCTSQTAEKALYVGTWCQDISWNDGWFEGLYRAIHVDAFTQGVYIKRNRFANAGADGAGGGYVARFEGAAYGTFIENNVVGNYDKVLVCASGHYGVHSRDNVVPVATGTNIDTKFSGVSFITSISGGGRADVWSNTHALVNTSATALATIDSTLFPGQILTLTALSGPILLTSGGNITFGQRKTPVVVPNGNSVQLMRTDTNGPWALITDTIEGVSIDNGDAAATLTWGTSKPTQIWATPLTADRAVTLSTTNAHDGSKFRIVRKSTATGAFNLNVGTGPLKAMGTAGSFVDVEYDGAAWVLTGYGVL